MVAGFHVNASSNTKLPPPKLNTRTETSITINPIEGSSIEYRILNPDGVFVQREPDYFNELNRPVFEGLRPGTEYGFQQRIAGTELFSDLVYIKTEAINYLVTFDSMGGTPLLLDQFVVDNGEITRPRDPVKASYPFLFWSKTKGGLPYNFDSPVTESVTLYANWLEVGIQVEDIVGGKRISIAAPQGASTYYTTNGTTPTISGLKYTEPFNITLPGTYSIKAMATFSEKSSPVATSDSFMLSSEVRVGTKTDYKTGIVEIPVEITENPGIESAVLKFDFHKDLILERFDGTGGMRVDTGVSSVNNRTVRLQCVDKMTSYTGKLLVTLVFRVKENAARGAKEISIIAEESNLYNPFAQVIPVQYKPGAVNVDMPPSVENIPPGGGANSGGDNNVLTVKTIEDTAAKNTTDEGVDKVQDEIHMDDAPQIPFAGTKTKSDYFDDVDENWVWAVNEIDYLYEAEVVKGTAARIYSPDNNITRGDFMLMMVRAFDLYAEYDEYAQTQENFRDVPEDSYYYDAILSTKVLGIAKGDGENFNPQMPITRQDMMVIIDRTFQVIGKPLSDAEMDVLSFYMDRNLVAAYAEKSVAKLVHAEIIKGSDNRINPLGDTTRAELAVVLYRVLMLTLSHLMEG